jgi:DNA polymerase V
MDKLGIFHGTKLVLDKAIQPKDGDVVIAHLNGGCLIKMLHIKQERGFLCPMSHNSAHQIVEVKEFDQFYIQGVVIGIHTSFISKEEIRRRKL